MDNRRWLMRCLAVAVLVALAVPGSALAWAWPTDGPVLRPFLFDRAQPELPGQHRGIDVAGAAGATVASPLDGVVTFAGSTPGNGLTLSIRTADGYSVTLTHLGSLETRRGASVEEGAAVARVGPSGPEVDEPYVHLGIRLASDEDGYLDPLSFLPPRPAASPPAPPAPPAAVPAVGADAQPAVERAVPAAAAAPAQEQPVFVQAAPAPPSSSGSPGPPSAAPPSAQPNEPIEPEPAPASSYATIGTPDDGATVHPQPAHHVTRGHVEPQAVTPMRVAPRPRLQIESPQSIGRAAAPTTNDGLVVAPV